MDFTVRRIEEAYEPDEEWDSFSFGIDDGSTDGEGIIFMRSSDYDLERASPEAATEPYYIGTGNGLGTYGGLTGIRLDRRTLELDFNEKSLEALHETDQTWILPLDIDDDSFAKLKNYLNQVFRSANPDGNGLSIEGFLGRHANLVFASLAARAPLADEFRRSHPLSPCPVSRRQPSGDGQLDQRRGTHRG